MMWRSPRQVFESYREGIEIHNIAKVMENYEEDAILVTPVGSFAGKESIQQEFIEKHWCQCYEAKLVIEDIYIEGDLVLAYWRAEAENVSIPHGVWVLLIQDSLIQRQAEWVLLQPKE